MKRFKPKLKNNCFGACLTHILQEAKEIDLRVPDDIPNRREVQMELFRKEVAKRGFAFLRIDIRDETVRCAMRWPLDTAYIINGAHRTGAHSIVVKNDGIVFDTCKPSRLLYPYEAIFILK